MSSVMLFSKANIIYLARLQMDPYGHVMEM